GNSVMPFLQSPLSEFGDRQLAQGRQDIGPCRALNSTAGLTAAPQVLGQISGEGVCNRERTVGRNKVTSNFPRLAGKDIASLSLRLRERKCSEVVRVTGIIRGAQGFIVLTAHIVAKPRNPLAAFGSTAISQSAAFPLGSAKYFNDLVT